jgi:hypothetical protein
MTDTTSSEDCNCNPHEECTAYPPVELGAILAAAVDGRDMEIASAAILAHPVSICFPKDLIEDLGNAVFAPARTDDRIRARIAVASSFILKLEGTGG